MKNLIMAFSGPSNSGKTTLITKIANKFINDGLKVLIFKHDPADKAQFDVNGKDSFKFFQSGADVFVLSPTRTTCFLHSNKNILESIKMYGEFDICLVEGLKTLDLPRISVFCKNIDESYFKYSNAIASYEKIKQNDLVWLDLNDVEKICDYILKNSRRIDARSN